MNPYVISKAHPDYKRPYVEIEYGALKNPYMSDEFVQEATYLISQDDTLYDIYCNRKVHEKNNGKQLDWDYIEKYVKSETYMDNYCVEMKIYADGKWHDWLPKLQDIWKIYDTEKVSD